MARFNNLAMSKDLAKDNRISTTKSFFGLCSKTKYDATGSLISGSKREYTAEAGGKIERALKASADQFDGFCSVYLASPYTASAPDA